MPRMLKALWVRNGDYLEVSNLLDVACYNIRIYTESIKNSEAVWGSIEGELKKLQPKLKVFSGLQCR